MNMKGSYICLFSHLLTRTYLDLTVELYGQSIANLLLDIRERLLKV